MKIAVITEWFSEKMGYAENMLPKALAALGHEVHVVSSTAQVYFSSPIYKETYEPFLGPGILPAGVKTIDGYTLHRLPVARMEGMPGIRGLQEYLEDLKPDVVQTFDVSSDSTYDAAIACKNQNLKLFTASHFHASIFRSKKKNWRTALADLLRNNELERRVRFISKQTIRCYPIAPDAARIVQDFYRVPKSKIKVEPLGVDTDLFFPPAAKDAALRDALRIELNFHQQDIVCIYTGRFAKDKNPQCLADAIDLLQKKGENIFGLFVGNGSLEETNEISSKKGCLVKAFVPVQDLRKLYWLADIGAWPAQESTSQLDAMACGLPLILSNKIEVMERIEGNGLLYEEGNAYDLAKKISELKNPRLRDSMSRKGIEKVQKQFSWLAIARRRVEDYSFPN